MKLTKLKKKTLLLLGIGLLAAAFLTSGHIPSPPKTADKGLPQYPSDHSDSLWVVVNKGRVLPAAYVPSALIVPAVPLRYGANSPQMQLRAEAAQALEKLVVGASSQGANLMLASGYRSYETQAVTYQSEVAAYGVAQADAESARPGHSEHQTGLAADVEPSSHVCEIQDCFANTPEGKWLAANAYRYGFIVRYKKDQASLTGYRYEPWHIRFIGTELAAKLNQTNQTLEQYFHLPSYTDYPAQIIQLK